MGKQINLTLREENKVLKDCMLFILSSLEFHDKIYQEHVDYWVELLKNIGTYKYVLDDDKEDDFMKLLNKKKTI